MLDAKKERKKEQQQMQEHKEKTDCRAAGRTAAADQGAAREQDLKPSASVSKH